MKLYSKNLILKILKREPGERISLVDMLKHPFFKEKLNNSHLEDELIKPNGIKIPPFLLSKYTIEYYDTNILANFKKEQKEKTKQDINQNEPNKEITGSNNPKLNDNNESLNLNNINKIEEKNNTKSVTEAILASEDIGSNSLPMNGLKSIKSIDNYPKDEDLLMNNDNSLKIFSEQKELGQDSISNFDEKGSFTQSIGGDNYRQLYSNLIKDYEKLNKNYKDILNINQDQKLKIEELNSKNNLLQREKESLFQEVDKTITEKLKLQSELEIKKQKLE